MKDKQKKTKPNYNEIALITNIVVTIIFQLAAYISYDSLFRRIHRLYFSTPEGLVFVKFCYSIKLRVLVPNASLTQPYGPV